MGKTSPSYLDKNRVRHVYDDCPNVQGKLRKIHDKEWRYRTCAVCSKRTDDKIHEAATNLRDNESKYIAEFVNNAAKSGLTDEEKEKLVSRGVLQIRALTLLYEVVDSIVSTRKGGSKDVEA